MSNLVNKYKDNPLLGGYEMMDEPLFEKLSWLKAIHDKIRELDPKHLVYTNLAVDMTPSSSEWKDHLGDIGTLEEYLDYFQNMFHPVLWSYDFYPVRYYNGRTIVRTSDFYKFLQMFHDKAKKANRPFWTYSLCMPYVENAILLRHAYLVLIKTDDLFQLKENFVGKPSPHWHTVHRELFTGHIPNAIQSRTVMEFTENTTHQLRLTCKGIRQRFGIGCRP